MLILLVLINQLCQFRCIRLRAKHGCHLWKFWKRYCKQTRRLLRIGQISLLFLFKTSFNLFPFLFGFLLFFKIGYCILKVELKLKTRLFLAVGKTRGRADWSNKANDSVFCCWCRFPRIPVCPNVSLFKYFNFSFTLRVSVPR